ncbi:hypothetical protein C8J98_102455 [Luteibacter sp. OK325]|nr:hypothetical protein C8J98_102455 [Luteibacter sp. OK325]
MLSFFLLCLLFVLIFRHKTGSMARFLRQFKLGHVFAVGFAGFYLLLFALCKAHNGLSDALNSFYSYVRSPSIALLAVTFGGFLVFTVWVFSSRTTSDDKSIRTGVSGEAGAATTVADGDKADGDDPDPR